MHELTNVKDSQVQVRKKWLLCRSAPPGMLAGQWQAANFEDDRPLRCRELLQVLLEQTTSYFLQQATTQRHIPQNSVSMLSHWAALYTGLWLARGCCAEVALHAE